MLILDTDYMTLLQWPDSPASKKIRDRLQHYPEEEIATTIVSFQEQMDGWLSTINSTKQVKEQVDKYRYMKQNLLQYCSIILLDFDELAAVEFQRLRKQYRRLGAMDLKIAAIAITRQAILLTRNLQHFEQIAGLQVEDCTKG